MKSSEMNLASMLQEKNDLTLRQELGLVWKLSVPAILAQITSIVMQYIDAAMVGKMGANASAAIGLVSSSTWLLGGLCSTVSAGFYVQVAHSVGAGDEHRAKQILKYAISYALIFSIILVTIGASISGGLPVWLGGDKMICGDATRYFLVFSLSIPFMQINNLAGSMLQCSGNMRVPSILNACACVLDVIFNMIFIFPTRVINIFSVDIKIFGLGLGVTGAALGTAMAEVVVSLIMLWFAAVNSPILRLSRKDKWIVGSAETLKKAFKIAVPMAVEHCALCGAQVMSTRIVAPLGTIAIAANSFGITAESLCYMPGFGVAAAATTLVGQSIGASNRKLARKLAWISTIFGMTIMGVAGAIMYVAAPYLFAILTPDATVRALGVKVLRIEVFAEPFYGASIVASGALRGAGDTLVPSIMNLISMWGIRLTLAVAFSAKWGLTGVWIAMCIELCARGIMFLVRLKGKGWINKRTS